MPLNHEMREKYIQLEVLQKSKTLILASYSDTRHMSEYIEAHTDYMADVIDNLEHEILDFFDNHNNTTTKEK